jgi:hypothetical protein
MGIVLYGLVRWGAMNQETPWVLLVAVLGGVFGGAAFYAVSAYFLKCQEVKEVFEIVRSPGRKNR